MTTGSPAQMTILQMAPFLLRLQELAPFRLRLQELAPDPQCTLVFIEAPRVFLWVSVTSQKHSELFT